MTTPTIEQMQRHASVRHYRPDPVLREWIETIVAAGQRASTSSNLQAYSAVAVTDPQTRARLAQLCGDQDHVHQAPVFLAWCADWSRLDRVCHARGITPVHDFLENFLVAAVDVALAMQNAALAAESLGLGMCFIGAVRNRPLEVGALLQLPKLVFPIAGMTLGWPAGAPRMRPRLPLEAVLHWERYDATREDTALTAYDQTMNDTGIYNDRHVPAPGREAADYGWREHSARRAATPIRQGLKAALEQQGFGLK